VPPPVMTAVFPAKSFMGFAHLSVNAVSDRPPDVMFTWRRAATQAASQASAALATTLFRLNRNGGSISSLTRFLHSNRYRKRSAA
jgi:hypothetical protein